MKLGNGWDDVVNYVYYKQAQAAAEEFHRKERTYPHLQQVFNAFYTPYDDVKVVILGQDPYPGTDKYGIVHAHGLAFSSAAEQTPQSLQNIFKELADEYGKMRTMPNLTDWTRAGVLLLNTSLTVAANKPNSHAGRHYSRFVINVIKQLLLRKENLVYMLWGRAAQDTAKLAGITHTKNNLVLTAPHPSPMSAHTGFFGCNHFKLANRYLKEHGKTRIDWIGAFYYEV